MKTIYVTVANRWLAFVWLMSLALCTHALAKSEGSLSLTQPTYNCQTGAITFNTSGGDGSPITFSAPGIIRSSLTSNTGTVEQELRNDPKPITITAMQNGQMASYVFDFGAYCANPQPPQPPMGSPLTMLAPTYDCTTGAFRFNTSGGNGTPIEYWAAPGITNWTTNPNQFVDMESRTATDVKPFTLMARQSGVTVTYTWNLRAVCPNPPAANPLTMLPPTYDCTTGAFRFNTSGGNGTLIEYRALPGITDWTTNPNQFVDMESRTATDVKPFTLMARQSGVLVTYVWNLRAVCPNPPAINPLTLLAPSYDCTTGAFRFNTSGGNGTLIEYRALPGITDWTTNPNQFVDRESRTASDVRPFRLMARQSGVLVTYEWDLKTTCGRARMPAEEPKAALQVQVLGNPVASKTAEVEIKGVSGQAVQLDLIDLQGRVLHQHTINQAGLSERVSVPLDSGRGLLLLTVSTPTQRQQIKLLRP